MNIETANRLLQYRKQNNLSQEQLAEKIGVSRQAVSKWERAEASPDTDNLIMLAQVYGVTLDELLNPAPDKEEVKEYTNNATDAEESAESIHNGDKVSFRGGIHVNSENGDNVDISFKDGIHVDTSEGAHVHIGGGKVHITDKDGNIQEHKHPSWAVALLYIPFPIIITIAFLCWGFSGELGGWSTAWMSFLTIPLFYSFIDAIRYKDGSRFAFPVLVALVFLVAGMFFGLWHPAWIVFLLIPVYYCICEGIKKALHKDSDPVTTEQN